MTKKSIENALGIGDKIRQIEEDENNINEDEKRKRFEVRKNEVSKIKAEIQKLKENPDDNFIKEGLRELASIGLQSMRILQDEVEIDPNGRAVECMAAMSNSVTAALKQLQSVELDKEKMKIEKEKVNIKKTASLPAGKTINNVLVTGSVSDLIKAMKDKSFDNQDELAMEEVRESEIRESKGSPFTEQN
jgi:hypothetical protein